VELGNGVRVTRRAERERRQPEAGLGRFHLAERSELLPGEAATLDESLEIPPYELGIEHLVPGRHRRVRGEHGRGAQPLERLVRRQPLLLDELAHALELEEGGMALVHVENGRLEAEPAQNADAADSEHELLPQPVLAVAAVEPVGHVSCPVGVPLHLRVEEVEGDAPDARAPDAEPHRDEVAAVVGELDHRRHRYELER
jgi:hypothetical protein